MTYSNSFSNFPPTSLQVVFALSSCTNLRRVYVLASAHLVAFHCHTLPMVPSGLHAAIFRHFAFPVKPTWFAHCSLRLKDRTLLLPGPSCPEDIRKKHAEISYDMVFFLPTWIIFLPSLKMMDFSYQVESFSYVDEIFLHGRHNFLPSSNFSYIILAFSYAFETISYMA
jgi:hypothetical protein